MAGHSKWANIQHRKNAQDRKRGKLFTKLIREITVAARAGGDPGANPRLRLAVDRALTANMAKDTVERAIRRGSGGSGESALEEIRYEGYAPGGVAIMVDCMTDNRTRTVAEVRHAFSKHGGNLGADGSVAYLFQRRAVLGFETGADAGQAERILELALETAAEDVQTGEGWTEVLAPPEALEPVRQTLAAAGFNAAQAEITQRPMTTVRVEGAQAETVFRLLEALDELDDVQNVYTNADLPESLLNAA
jgi:YebC/PmpR family DNA-binding regulatory protein